MSAAGTQAEAWVRSVCSAPGWGVPWMPSERIRISSVKKSVTPSKGFRGESGTGVLLTVGGVDARRKRSGSAEVERLHQPHAAEVGHRDGLVVAALEHLGVHGDHRVLG